MSNISILKYIKKIISQIRIIGIDIKLLVKILASNILLLDTGKLLVISIFFPSNEIIDDVIDVIKLINIIIHKNILGSICFTVSIEISDSILFKKLLTNPLKFTASPIVATTIKTSPKPAFIINTGDEKNLFSSLYIRAFTGFLTLYLSLFTVFLLLIPFSDDFDDILK